MAEVSLKDINSLSEDDWKKYSQQFLKNNDFTFRFSIPSTCWTNEEICSSLELSWEDREET